METTMVVATWAPAALVDVAAIVARDEYDHYGVRVVTPAPDGGPTEAPAVGAELPASYAWDDGESTGEGLDGTSAVDLAREWDGNVGASVVGERAILRAARTAANYHGRYIALLGAHSAGSGDDHGETVMRDPVVLAVYDRGAERCDWDAWGGSGACRYA